MSAERLERLYRDGLTNAVLSWLFVGVLGLVFAESATELDLQWMVFVATATGIAALPAAATRGWRVMPPWELLGVALLPMLVRGLLGADAGVGLFASYMAVAALALLVIVELDAFTALEVTHWFAVVLVVMATMASGAAWAVIRWTLDRLLGTTYLLEPSTSQTAANAALMTEFLWVTVAGFVAGVVFDLYFRWRDRHLKEAVEADIPEAMR